MNIVSHLVAVRQFFKLGWHAAVNNINHQDAECRIQNQEAFKKEIKNISSPHIEELPDDETSAENCYLRFTNAIKCRRLEIKQLFHEYDQCLFLGTHKISAYGLIVLLILTEALMIRPTLRNLFSQFGFIESFSYMTALVIGLSIMIHIAGTSLRSERYALATGALLIIVATNALLIIARSMATESSWLFTNLFACVAILVTKCGIYLTYRLSHNERINSMPAADFVLLGLEYRDEGRAIRHIQRRFRRYQSLENAFYHGYYAQKVSKIAIGKIRTILGCITTASVLLFPSFPVAAADLSISVSPRSSTVKLGQAPIGLKLSVAARNPERLQRALIGVQVQITGEGFAEKFRLKSAADIDTWSWMPVSPGDYRIQFSARTPGGYPITAHSSFKVINPELGFSEPQILPFESGKEFEVTVPVPEIPYPNLDICFLFDISTSMNGDIESFKRSVSAILDSLKSVSNSQLASVVSFSHVEKNQDGLLEPANYSLAIEPTNNGRILSGMQLGNGGGNESGYYALHYASQLDIFRPDALRCLILMTDEIDNVYGNESDLNLSWNTTETLSPRSILTGLKKNNFCVGMIYSGLSEKHVSLCYSDTMATTLQTQFAGAHALAPSGRNTSSRIVNQIQTALARLVGQTQLLLKVASPENSQWISAIEPAAPSNCITGNGFNLGRLKQHKISEMTFRIKLSSSAPKTPQHFFIEGSTDKGTVNHLVPIVLAN